MPIAPFAFSRKCTPSLHKHAFSSLPFFPTPLSAPLSASSFSASFSIAFLAAFPTASASPFDTWGGGAGEEAGDEFGEIPNNALIVGCGGEEKAVV